MREFMGDEKALRIQLFGTFALEWQGQTYIVGEEMGKQLRSLFQMLAVAYPQSLSKEQLIERLFNNGQKGTSSLKYAVFRLREHLNSLPGLEDMEIIVTNRMGYGITEEIPVEVDIRLFDDVVRGLEDKTYHSRAQLESAYQTMRQLYKGDFACGAIPDHQLQEQRIYYRNLYMEGMEHLYLLLRDQKQYEEALNVCRDVLELDPLQENFHSLYIRALMDMEEYDRALVYYNQTNEFMLKNTGRLLSDETRTLWGDIVAHHSVPTKKLADIQGELMEKEVTTGPFYCTYDLFQYIYQLAVRRQKRSETAGQFIILLELKGAVSQNQMMRYMHRLRDAIQRNLRVGDVFTQYSNSSYLLLVPCQAQENGYALIQRMSRAFYNRVSSKLVKFNYNIEPVTGGSNLARKEAGKLSSTPKELSASEDVLVPVPDHIN